MKNNKKNTDTSQSSFGTIFGRAKKGIGPVVAISLLIVVAVSSVIGLQSWFSTYQSNIHSKAEITSSNSLVIDLNYVENTGSAMMIYFNNPDTNYVIINSIRINSVLCTNIGSDVLSESSITKVEVTGCNVERDKEAEIVLITSKGIYSKKIMVK